MNDCNGNIDSCILLIYLYLWVIPISHYRPTAQLMKDRDRQE